MSSFSKVSLSSLRDIGWSLWDPICLMPEGGTWDHDDSSRVKDEYDNCLTNAAAQLHQGKSEADVIGYLANVEIHDANSEAIRPLDSEMMSPPFEASFKDGLQV